VKPHAHEYREYLAYEFPVRKPAETVAELQWEELAVPWTIRVANVNDIYVSRLRQELTSVSGFSWQGFQSAAQYCLQENTNLEQGLKWADDSISKPFIGEANFTTLSTKAQILSKLGRDSEAKPIMETAIKLPSATPLAIHQYGRQLLAAKKVDEAMTVFEYNASRNGDQWPIHVGLARAYAAKGDTKQALEHAKKALTQAPDPLNKQSLEAMVKALESGQSIN
jgi:predicted Zn-dependent protease